MPPGHPDTVYKAPSCRVGKSWVASEWGGIWVAPRCYLGAPGFSRAASGCHPGA